MQSVVYRQRTSVCRSRPLSTNIGPLSVAPDRCLETLDRRLQIQTAVSLSIRMSLGLPEAGEVFDLAQDVLPLLLQLGGEAAAGAQKEVGAGFSPEDGPLIV